MNKIKLFIQGKADVIIVKETKLDTTFPTFQFLIEGYSEPCRFVRNRNGDRVLLCVREDMPSKHLANHKLPHNIGGIFVELNLRKCK